MTHHHSAAAQCEVNVADHTAVITLGFQTTIRPQNHDLVSRSVRPSPCNIFGCESVVL